MDNKKLDFRQFLYIVWKHLGLPNPTDIQYDIADYIQKAPDRAIIKAFRGVGKSFITSAYVCYVLLYNPQLKVMVVSASKERADGFSTFVKRLINEIPILQHLKPKSNQRDSAVAFDVAPALPDHSPSVKSVGITGQMTGSRADLIIADDVEVPNNSATQTMRDKLSEAVKEFEAILKPEGNIIFLGTPQCEMSLYNALLDRGYEERVWTAEYPQIKDYSSYKGNLAPKLGRALAKDNSLAGKPTEPLRFGFEELLKRKQSIGAATYQLQYMLNTALSDADRFPLKISDLIVQNLNPVVANDRIVWSPTPDKEIKDIQTIALNGDRYYYPAYISQEMSEYQGSVMAIDPSGRGSDETGFAVIKAHAGNLFLTAAGGLHGGYETKTLEELAKIAKTQKVNKIIVEANFGDGMYTQLLKPVMNRIYPCMIEEVKNTKQKELRIIETLEPVMSTHRLIVDRKVIERDFQTAPDIINSLFYQMTRLTRDRGALSHDDRLDALAMAVGYWKDILDIDNEKAAEKLRQDRFDEEFDRLMREAGISWKSGHNWTDYTTRPDMRY